MKGTVVTTWLKSCRRLYGDELVNTVLESCQVPRTRVFTPLEDVEDGLTTRIMNGIASAAGVDPKDMWLQVGMENIESFYEAYSGFFRHDSLYSFLSSMNDVHIIVMKRFKGAKPPVLDMEPLSSRTAYFTYRSRREMEGYLLGLLRGAARRFGEELGIETVEKSPGIIKLKLTFEKPIRVRRFYPLNLLFSLGFVRSAAFQIALFSALGMGATAVLFLKQTFGEALPLAGITFGVVLVASLLLHLPQISILKDLRRFAKRDFSGSVRVYSNDGYSRVNKRMNELKEGVQKDFIGFNAVVDEMYTFNKSISKIGETMDSTSDDIARIISELADGAVAQAEDTEKSIAILNENLRSVVEISEEEQRNKALIEKAASDIGESFSNVRVTVDTMTGVMTKFAGIRDEGNVLKRHADEITEIVSVVSAISRQINLLAINASIEAASAGEAGRGFAVVAEDVRMLANETKQAVESIDENLSGFVGRLQSLVGDLDTQYGVLEEESGKLSQAVETTDSANDQINTVAERMQVTSERLQAQTASISTLSSKMEGLAAIAQENSASSEEASANIHTYTVQIKELLGQVAVFEKMVGDFKEEIGKYVI